MDSGPRQAEAVALPWAGVRMRRLIFVGLATLVALLLWTGIFLAGTLEGWWRRPLAPRGDTRAFMAAATRMIDAGKTGNLAFQLIQRGQPVDGRFVSIGKPVDRDTLFQVASLSKWVTALGVMTLVDAGRVDLDAPVDTYLKRWKLPPSDFDNRQVTVRRILSHTAGLTDGLGYAGFKPGQPIQSLPESLTRTTPSRRRVGLLRRRLHAAAAADRGRHGRVVRRLHAARGPGAARHVALDVRAARGRGRQPGGVL